jgi:hypothetical protein
MRNGQQWWERGASPAPAPANTGPSTWSGALYEANSNDALVDSSPGLIAAIRDRVNGRLWAWSDAATRYTRNTALVPGKVVAQKLTATGTDGNIEFVDTASDKLAETINTLSSWAICFTLRASDWKRGGSVSSINSGLTRSTNDLGGVSLRSRGYYVEYTGSGGTNRYLWRAAARWSDASSATVTVYDGGTTEPDETTFHSVIYNVTAFNARLFFDGVAMGAGVALGWANVSTGTTPFRTRLGYYSSTADGFWGYRGVQSCFSRALTAGECAQWHTYAMGQVT